MSGSDQSSARAPLAYDEVIQHLTVTQILSAADKLVGFPPDAPSSQALSIMSVRGFDYAPIFVDGVILGRVRVEDLQDAPEPVGAVMERLTPSHLISAGASLREVMRWLAEDPWLLVVEGRRISGVVTPSDLNKQASRAYFYMLIADLEIRLADMIRDEYADQTDEMLSRLWERARSVVLKRFELYRDHDVAVDMVAVMDLDHLIKLATDAPGIPAAFGFDDSAEWFATVQPLTAFRHQIMHPARPVLDDRNGLKALIAQESTLRSLLGAR